MCHICLNTHKQGNYCHTEPKSCNLNKQGLFGWGEGSSNRNGSVGVLYVFYICKDTQGQWSNVMGTPHKRSLTNWNSRRHKKCKFSPVALFKNIDLLFRMHQLIHNFILHYYPLSFYSIFYYWNAYIMFHIYLYTDWLLILHAHSVLVMINRWHIQGGWYETNWCFINVLFAAWLTVKINLFWNIK